MTQIDAPLDSPEKAYDDAELDATERRMNRNIVLWDGGGRECGMVRMLSRDGLALIAEVRRLRAAAGVSVLSQDAPKETE